MNLRPILDATAPGISASWSQYKTAIVTALCFVSVAYLSAENYFIQDDGFITLRYVDHFLRGHGPVWYPGSDEFGYTNFLFMLLVTGLSLTGLDPVISANIVSYASFFTCALVTFLIALRLTSGNTVVAAVTVAVIFSNKTVSSYASGMLETSLQLALVTLTYYFTLGLSRRPDGASYIYLATAAATLGMLTRLDTVLLIAPAFVFLFHRIWTTDSRSRLRMTRHAALALAGAALVLSAFLLFCFVFYGQILPNTFDVKAGQNLGFGALYLAFFLAEELFIYPYLLAILFLHWYRTEGRLPSLGSAGGFRFALMAAGLVWTGYIVYVGGGFMGYRLMVPFILIFFLLTLSVIANRFGTALAVQLALIAMLTQLGQYFWFSTADQGAGRKIQTPAALHQDMTEPPHANPRLIGLRLNALFHTGTGTDVMIAVQSAGAIPYFSRLPAFDVHGLNTREVAMNGAIVDDRPGHQREATVEQVESAGVNLFVGGALCLADPGTIPREQRAFVKDGKRFPVLLIPLGTPDCWIYTFYVQPHPAVEQGIADNGFVLISER